MGQVSISGTAYDIYGTEAGAKVYFAAALHGSVGGVAWASLDSNQKKKAQVTASRMLDRAIWKGTRTAGGQPLEWPRNGVGTVNGVTIADGSTPVDVENASYELALALLGDATVQTAASSGSNTKRTSVKKKVDVIETINEVEYFSPTIASAGRFPTIVQELIGPYLSSAAQLSLSRASGTSEESAFHAGELANFGFNPDGLP